MGVRRLARDVLINGLCGWSVVPRKLRWRMLRFLGMDIKGWCAIAPGTWFGGTDISIGRDTTINYQCFFDNGAHIAIGERVDIGMQVMIVTGTHEFGDRRRRASTAVAFPVTIGDGTWVGARSTILPGVTIGEGCIIAAGAVVTTDCPPHTLCAGVPARPLRQLAR